LCCSPLSPTYRSAALCLCFGSPQNALLRRPSGLYLFS
jgi:hypothetical protein